MDDDLPCVIYDDLTGEEIPLPPDAIVFDPSGVIFDGMGYFIGFAV